MTAPAYPRNWAQLLVDINIMVNALPYTSDQTQFGTVEYWDNIDDHGTGDCEDYAIGKLRRLVKAGYPIESLHLATCQIPYRGGQGGHCVLVADTPDGRKVLSNGLFVISQGAFLALGYKPISIQTTGGRRDWEPWAAYDLSIIPGQP